MDPYNIVSVNIQGGVATIVYYDGDEKRKIQAVDNCGLRLKVVDPLIRFINSGAKKPKSFGR